MRTIIVDDEKTARDGLKQLLEIYCPDVNVIGEAVNIKDALTLCKRENFDLLFLDIGLPDGTGVDFLKMLSDRDFSVIFITAFDQYAVDAFRLSAVDYLLKPINTVYLVQAVEKAQTINEHYIKEASLSILLNNWSGQKRKIMLKDVDNVHMVDIENIMYCSAQGCYTNFHLTQGRQILISVTLKEYERTLVKHGFIRIHRSHLVNYLHISRFSKVDGNMVVLNDGTSLPVAVRKKDTFIKALNAISESK